MLSELKTLTNFVEDNPKLGKEIVRVLLHKAPQAMDLIHVYDELPLESKASRPFTQYLQDILLTKNVSQKNDLLLLIEKSANITLEDFIAGYQRIDIKLFQTPLIYPRLLSPEGNFEEIFNEIPGIELILDERFKVFYSSEIIVTLNPVIE